MNTENLKKAREKKGMTQAQAAEKLGVSDGTYKNYEQGKREPNNTILTKIADLYSVSTDYLLGRSNDKPNPIDALARESGMHDVERILLKMYFKLDAEKRAAFMESMLEEIKQSKPKGKITFTINKFSTYKVSAGVGYDLNDGDSWTTLDVVDVPEAHKADFALEIDGNSMEPKYHDGDIVLVKETPAVDVGEIGIFTINGTGYIKKFGGDKLISLNSDYNDIPIHEYDNYRCCGKVIGVTRRV